MSFFNELKRRNVVRVAIAYTVASWLLVQVGDIARESFEAPAWVMKMLITALIVGFPIVVFFSWAFEITPEGIKREKDINRSDSIVAETGARLNYITIALLVCAIVVVGADRYLLAPAEPARQVATPTQPSANPVGVAATAPSPEATNTSDRNSIAVLPFINMSDDPSQEYFSDGISEELLNLLVKVDGLNVASRTSSFAFKGSTASIPDIARQLKVTNVLEGSVRKAGNRVRITAQLIDTANDRHLWSETYDRELIDIFAIQDEISSAIVAALASELGLDLDADKVSVEADTQNMDAYELFLKGRALVIARQDLAEAVDLLERATELDPQFARAWSMLGMAYYLIPSWNTLTEAEDADFNLRAEKAVNRALELDERQSLAWAVKGMLTQYAPEGADWETQLALTGKATEMDPSNATAWLWNGLRYTELGFHEQARQQLVRCLEVDPAYQNCRRHLSRVLLILGRPDEAVELYVQIARSGLIAADTVFVEFVFREGNLLAGLFSANYLRTRYPDFPMEEWVNGLEHPEQDHTVSLPRVMDWIESTPNPPIGMKESLLLAIGAYDRIKLDKSYVNNWIWLPGNERFRASPHFQRIIRDMNLPAYWDKYGLPPGCEKTGEEYICE